MKQNSILTGLKEAKELNLKNNLEYIDAYSDYVKKTDNKTWSNGQKKFLDILYSRKRRSNKVAKELHKLMNVSGGAWLNDVRSSRKER